MDATDAGPSLMAPTPVELRAELERLIAAELLGPADGEEDWAYVHRRHSSVADRSQYEGAHW